MPFYSAPVSLVTVLHLDYAPPSRSADTDDDEDAKGKYYISAQNDLYQTNEFVRFFWPGGFLVVWLWQFVATLCCVLGAFVLSPFTAVQEYLHKGGGLRGREVPESLSARIERKYL